MTEIKQLITVENDNLCGIKIDQTVICDGRFYSQMEPTFCIKSEDKGLTSLYANPLMYYPSTEDMDFESLLSKLENISHQRINYTQIDNYTNDDAETQYLLKDLVSYIVLGKPDIGQVDIAKMLSDSAHCVNINPLTVVSDELKSESRAGKCIAYNLEAGRAVEPEIILRLVEKRVKSQSAQHRGFVINGFPLVANGNYKEDPISSESAIFNVQDIFEELMPPEMFAHNASLVSIGRQVSHVEEENTVSGTEEGKSLVPDEFDDEEIIAITKKKKNKPTDGLNKSDVDLGPSDLNIVTKFDDYHDLACPKKQLEFIFNLFENKPLVIIYISCDNIDVIRKRQNYRFDVSKQIEFSVNPLKNEIIDYYHAGNKTVSNKEDADSMLTFDAVIDGTQMKHIVKLLQHRKSPVSAQIRQYKCVAKPIIDNKVLNCNTEYFIKVDGRLPSLNMYNNVRTRLKTLGLQSVLIPQKIGEEHGGEDDILPIEDSFKLLRVNQLCGPMYKYELSNWRYKCPVSLKEGRIVQGKVEYAVKFMSKIYFLSSEESMKKFCKNPRPFLLPTVPNPTCRIWVFGPKQSGKSAIAQCLSLLFNCNILNLEELERNFENSKYLDYIEKLRTAAITEALVTINNNRKLEREETIEEWMIESRDLLNQIIDFKNSKSKTSLKSTGSDTNEIIETFDFKLHVLNLPPYSETEILSSLVDNDKELMKYLPEIFSRPIEPATVFDQFVKSYVKTAINSAIIPDMTLTPEEKVDMIKSAIQETEDNYYQLNNTRGGWIIDGMFTNTELLNKLCPEYLADDIICIRDTDAEHTFLMAKFSNKESSSMNDLTTFFNHMKKFRIAEKIKDVYFSNQSRLHVIHSLLNDIGELATNKRSTLGSLIEFKPDALITDKNLNYLKSVKEFHQQWDMAKNYLASEHNASVIEINLENKTMHDLLKEAVINIENKYRILAYVMTETDHQEEMEDYAGEAFLGEEPGEDDEGADEAGEGTLLPSQVKFYHANRRLGTTNIYCPVVFDRYFVLWKGNDLYTASFEQAVYYLSSENALNEFVADPRLFINHEPPNILPPPRICIIGPTGSGKTSCAKTLANNFGLHYVNFDHIILHAINLPTENFNDILKMDVKLDDDILTNLDHLNIIKNYLEYDAPLYNELIKQVLTPLWFQEPYINVGFVLDNFPRRPSDVATMLANFFIPDIVIELLVSQEIANTRKYPILLNKRKKEIQKHTLIVQEEYEIKCNKWQDNRYVRLQQLLEEKREQFQRSQKELFRSSQKLTTPIDSNENISKFDEIEHETVMLNETEEEEVEEEYAVTEYDIFQQQLDFEDANDILNKEMPEPVFENIIPSDEEISETLHTGIDNDYLQDLEFLEYVTNNLQEFNIQYATVTTSDKTEDKVFYEVLRLTDSYKFRNRSFFERVYEITMLTAERLLKQGYYFISRFGMTCPVQKYENKNPIQMYLPAEYNNIYPLIYRRYIYFVHTEESRDKFKNNPVEYTTAYTNSHFPLIPTKIAIIGPPKAGKSTLAKRLQQEFQFNVITRGNAIRYVLNNFPHSYLAENITKVLRSGWSVTYEMAAKAVEALTMDAMSITQGYILDGFPSTDQEMEQFSRLGIVPHIILDVRTTKPMIYQNLATVNPPEHFRIYSVKYLNGVYYNWEKDAYEYRQWLFNTYQNVKTVENKKCKWHLCEQAKPHIISTMHQFHEYFFKKNFDVVIDLTSLCITPKEFITRQSLFRNYCPICWMYSNILEESGPFPDRRNVVQYLNSFYYICGKHRRDFFYQPTHYIPPRNLKLLPEHIPTIVNHSNKYCYYEDGLCIPCFWDNQPDRILQNGSNNFITKYKNQYYRFCSEKCTKAFFRTPNKYNTISIHFRDTKPMSLGVLSKIPTLGYLEQLAGQLVIDAVINTEIERPYHPGLTIAKSAALHMGLYLKIHNPNTSEESKHIYNEAKNKYDFRTNKLRKKIEHFKSRINPFVCVDKMRTDRYKYERIYEEDEDDYSESGTSKDENYSQLLYNYHDYYAYSIGEHEDYEE